MLIKSVLQPIEIKDLIRLGRDNDGGYILPKSVIENCNGLLSYGINKDWSFEKDFSKFDSIKNVHCYDHTLNLYSLIKFTIKSILLVKLYILTFDKIRFKKTLSGLICIPDYFIFFSKNIFHFKKKISNTNSLNESSILKTIEKIKSFGSNKLFIKMDIEGYEYDTLNELLNSKEKIYGLAVEFHDINKRSDDFNHLINKLKTTYHIAHIHGNNYSKIDKISKYPSSVEITFINKKLIKKPITSSKFKYPIDNLDQPNKHSKADIELNF